VGLLAPSQTAKYALRRWLSSTNLEELGQAERRLLPLVCDRVKELGIDVPQLALLTGMKRHAFAGNARMIHSIKPVLSALSEIDIPVAVIKGAALAYANYKNPAMRPMMDVDLVVRPNQFLESIQVFRALGWKPQNNRWPETELDVVLNGCNLRLHEAVPVKIDLHFAFGKIPSSTAQIMIWSSVMPYSLGDISVGQPSPSDHLVLILEHGLALNSIHPLRWVIDAAKVIETSRIEWGRFVQLSDCLGVSTAVADQLEYLQRIRPDLVPQRVLSTLRNEAKSRIPDRREKLRDKPFSQYNLSDLIATHKLNFDLGKSVFPNIRLLHYTFLLAVRAMNVQKLRRIRDVLRNSFPT